MKQIYLLCGMQIAPKRVIIERVQKMLKENKVSLMKLGEILAGRSDISPQAKHQKATRFLDGVQQTIAVVEVERLANFFNQPVSYFLYQDWQLQMETSPSDKLPPLEKIRLALEELGHDQEFIDAHIAGLKALQKHI